MKPRTAFQKNSQLLSRAFLFFLLVFSCDIASGWALSQPFDHSTWRKFLKTFVNEKGEVNYLAVQKDPSILLEYLSQIAKIDENEFSSDWPREEKIALLINLYNAGVIDAVRKHYPVTEINTIQNVWSSQNIQLGKTVLMSLDNLRLKSLILIFRDEKIHTALACGARGCPRLRQEPYAGPTLDGQLFMAAREFVNNGQLNKIDSSQNKIFISPIFKWYGNDFKLDFATAENDRGLTKEQHAVLSFIGYYLEDPEKAAFLEDGDYKIKYSEFDWSLNEWSPGA